MKKIFYILMGAALSLTVISCGSNDDFTETIFDTETPDVDQNATTAPFDQWLTTTLLFHTMWRFSISLISPPLTLTTSLHLLNIRSHNYCLTSSGIFSMMYIPSMEVKTS